MNLHGVDMEALLQAFPLTWSILQQAIALVAMVPWGPRIALLLFMLWVFYLAAMNLLRVHRLGKLGRVAFALGVVVMVTARLQRHHADPTWRGKVAQWFESELLGVFDPDGSHVAPRKGGADA